MAGWKLVMDWHYTYLKEGTWEDDEKGVSEFALVEGAEYGVPNIEHRKKMEVLSFSEENGVAVAEVRIDYHTYRLRSDGGEVVGSCGYEYSVCGDHVTVTVAFQLRMLPM